MQRAQGRLKYTICTRYVELFSVLCPCFLAGHETTFCALLYCLAKLGVVGTDDAQALVTRVFARYLQLMRKIQVLELEH